MRVTWLLELNVDMDLRGLANGPRTVKTLGTRQTSALADQATHHSHDIPDGECGQVRVRKTTRLVFTAGIQIHLVGWCRRERESHPMKA